MNNNIIEFSNRKNRAVQTSIESMLIDSIAQLPPHEQHTVKKTIDIMLECNGDINKLIQMLSEAHIPLHHHISEAWRLTKPKLYLIKNEV